MRIAIVGQQDFGKAVLEAFLARGDEVAGVFCAPVEISVSTRSYGCPVSSISHSAVNERERGDQ